MRRRWARHVRNYARQLAHLPVWQHDDLAMEKGKKIMSLWGRRARLSELAVRFRQLRRLLPGSLVTDLLTGSLKVTSKGEGSSRYNENYNKRPYHDRDSRDSRGREEYSRRGAGPPYGLNMGRKK